MLPVTGGETLPGTSLTLCPHSTYLYEFITNLSQTGLSLPLFGLSQLNFDLNLVFEVGGQKIEERWGGLENREFRVLAWSNSKSQTFWKKCECENLLNPWRRITGEKYSTCKVQRVIQRLVKVQLSCGDGKKLGMLDDYFILQIVKGWLYIEILCKKLKNRYWYSPPYN